VIADIIPPDSTDKHTLSTETPRTKDLKDLRQKRVEYYASLTAPREKDNVASPRSVGLQLRNLVTYSI